MSRRSPPYGLVLAVGSVCFLAGAFLVPRDLFVGTLLAKEHASPRSVSERAHPLTGHELGTIALFEQVSPSVVFIMTSHRKPTDALAGGTVFDAAPIEGAPMDGPLDEFEWDSGSGFVWDDRGHVVTNYHVVRDAVDLTVRLPDLSDWPGRLVGIDEDKDLAVLHVEAPASLLNPIVVGRSAPLRVGQRAYSIGNPFGLSSTLSEGIISAVGRTIRSGTGAGRIIQDVIQTDAAITPGNSGGPLLDSAGRLIGVTTAMVSDAGGSAGIGFAIPVDTVNRIVPDLINHGRPRRAGLGVRVQTEVDRRIDGVMIAYVLPGSAAERSGLRGSMNPETLRFGLGDVITGIEGHPVRTFDDLYGLLDTHRPGDQVDVTYRRKGKLHTTTIDLQVLPPEEMEKEGSGETP
ncbi:MAG: S1C family serine protease [Planctomycetota bacterium JB042]